jgi:hypothetical protein
MWEAADKTISAMVHWGLIERIPSEEKIPRKGKRYQIKPILLTIAQETNRQQTYASRLLLFDRVLRSEKDTAFNIGFFLKIRDSQFSSEVSNELNLPKTGVILSTANNLRMYLGISQLDFNILTSWCKQVGFINIFDPKSLEISSPKEVYLTVWIASVSELTSYYNRLISGRDIENSYLNKNCEMILEHLNYLRNGKTNFIHQASQTLDIRNNEILLKSLNSPFQSDLLILGEKNKNQKILLNHKIPNSEEIYLFLRKQLSLDDFVKELRNNYNKLKIRFKTPYVWIAPLRSLCARSLQITDKQFDDLLVQYYRSKPEAMEFSKAATGFFRRRVRIFEKPFKLYGQTFRMIRLVEST